MENNYYRLPMLGGLLVLGLLAAPSARAQGSAYLTVLDPQQNWNTYQGTIEEAVLSVHPKGIYLEYGLYLTFSARGTGFSSNRSLEVAFHFSLPEDAVVTDSWLWIGDKIIRAEIMDQWTASTIYEDIVDRRQDPSVLYKRGPGQYELRVYPMPGNGTRKVKLTYLVPARWTSQSVSASLPLHLLQASARPVPLHLLTWLGADWKNPRLTGHPGIAFEQVTDGVLGTYRRATLPWNAFGEGAAFALDAPLRDGLFLRTTVYDGEGWYQLALHPSAAMQLPSTRKVAFLIDYDPGTTTVTQNELLQSVRAQLHANFTPADSFTVIVSRLDIHRASEWWLPAYDEVIDDVFDKLGNNPLGGYSNLPALLANGLDFVREQDTGGSLLLISSSDQFGEVELANNLIQDLEAAASPLPPIHVADFVNRGFTSYWINGRYYLGNEYLYTNLSRRTGGNTLTLQNAASFTHLLGEVFPGLGGLLTSFDLYTTMEDGFTYGRLTLDTVEDAAYLDEVILQVGKYTGSFPFVVEASGMYGSQPFSQKIKRGEETIGTDSTLATLWAGQQIQALERRPQTNDLIAQIIDYSLDRRALSLYTAFLALEPNQGGEVCSTCVDETDGAPTDVEEELPEAGVDVLEAYPNPFSTEVTVHVALAQAVEASQLTLRIYNVMGQVVRTLRLDQAGLVREFDVVWDGTNDAGQRVANGTYFFVLTTPTARHTLTLTLVR